MTLLIFVATMLVLVTTHELGHFIAAKLAGVYVHEFAIGFGPKLFGIRRNETLYSVRLLLFGGFVRMAGEGLPDSTDEVPIERRLTEKPPLVRIAISLAGPLMNLLATFLLTLALVWGLGVPGLQVAETVPDRPASELLVPGDVVLAANGTRIIKESDLLDIIQIGGPMTLEIVRDEERRTIDIAPVYDPLESRYVVGAYFDVVTFWPEIIDLQDGAPLAEAGFQVADTLTAINDHPVETGTGLILTLLEVAAEQPPVRVLRIGFIRGSEPRTIDIDLDPATAGTEPEAGVDVSFLLAGAAFASTEMYYQRPGPGDAIVLASGQFVSYFRLIGDAFGPVFAGDVPASEAFTGPVGIAKMLSESAEQGPRTFLLVCAFLSLSLALINLVPFPGFDGSHVAFSLLHLLRRKPIPPRYEGWIHAIGFLILIVLLILITFNDVARLFG
ncbi:RIP metalloprotease RseP [Candidatus Bipolaricaulota bacterium]|nr:RIP metalloprotease RseP [Candidatus Bipolaricaulota bacterium]